MFDICVALYKSICCFRCHNTHMYAHIHDKVSTYIYLYMYMYIYSHTYIYIYHIHVYIQIHIYIFFIYTCICIYCIQWTEPWAMGDELFYNCKFGVLQYVLIIPVCAVIAFITIAAGAYEGPEWYVCCMCLCLFLCLYLSLCLCLRLRV